MPDVHPVHGLTRPSLASGLAHLASVAAIELDNLRLGQDQVLVAVPRLAEAIREAIPAQDAGGTRALLDPVKVDLFGQALESSGKVFTSVSEISLNTEAIAEKLSAIPPLSSHLVALRDFCVALSQTAQADAAMRLADRPASPFRR